MAKDATRSRADDGDRRARFVAHGSLGHMRVDLQIAGVPSLPRSTGRLFAALHISASPRRVGQHVKAICGIFRMRMLSDG